MNKIKEKAHVKRGLENVIAAHTRTSLVDGVNGELYYHGYSINDLAENARFEEVIFLFNHERLPSLVEYEELRAQIVSEMRLPSQVVKMIELSPPNAHPMDVLRTAVSMLGMFDPDTENNSQTANQRKAIRITAQVPSIVAALNRVRQNQPVLSADPKLNLSGNFLYMMNGRKPEENELTIMNLVLVLLTDHGTNASTFAARVVASTLAEMHSTVSAALSALKGPLHGGANQRVMEMLLQIDNIDEVTAYIDGMLDDKKRIMGFGHRVYKVQDPRTDHLRRYSELLCSQNKIDKLHQISQKVEQIVLQKKGIYPNVDFYLATILFALGITKEYFTPVFAIARTVGWVAHIQEQYSDNRLIRPSCIYEGKRGKKYIPINER
ncbi:MAG: citrate synthase [Desulfobacterales bacterium]|nr:citrate synthase [Desulfobacterales bacterium]